VGGLAANTPAPSVANDEALLNVVRYVGSAAGQGLICGGSDEPVGSWCDASFAACLGTRRSTTGWVVVVYGGAVSWASKQPTAAASTMDCHISIVKQACEPIHRSTPSRTPQGARRARAAQEEGDIQQLCQSVDAPHSCASSQGKVASFELIRCKQIPHSARTPWQPTMSNKVCLLKKKAATKKQGHKH
jgi:hypothetical protein